MNESHVLFLAVSSLSVVLGYYVFKAGLLWEWTVDLTKEAAKTKFTYASARPKHSAKDAFMSIVDEVPIDEVTGEVIITGLMFKRWVHLMKGRLFARAVESSIDFKENETYIQNTLCKVTTGLAPSSALDEAEMRQRFYVAEFNDIARWADLLYLGWGRAIIFEAGILAEIAVTNETKKLQKYGHELGDIATVVNYENGKIQ